MTASESVGGVDVDVAGRAERSRIDFVEKSCRGTLACLTHPHALVPRRHPVRRIDTGVAPGAQVRRVSAAVHYARHQLARDQLLEQPLPLGAVVPSFNMCLFLLSNVLVGRVWRFVWVNEGVFGGV